MVEKLIRQKANVMQKCSENVIETDNNMSDCY